MKGKENVNQKKCVRSRFIIYGVGNEKTTTNPFKRKNRNSRDQWHSETRSKQKVDNLSTQCVMKPTRGGLCMSLDGEIPQSLFMPQFSKHGSK